MLDTASIARESALVVLARYPRAGRVKSRLAAAIGETAAADLYRAFLMDVRRRFAGDGRWTLCWAFEPAESPFAGEIAGDSPAFPQSEGDLGERMAAAIGRAIDGGCRQVVLIGSDLPHLGVERIAEAFELLRCGAPLVLGPAEDGGYYLVGVRERVPPIFDGIRWGGPRVFGDTLAAADRAGIAGRLLAPTYDVDTPADLERLRHEIENGSVAGLDATRAVLERVLPLRYR